MSSCIYCSSSSYGRPCLFSPTKTHIHMDNPGKCIYCGTQGQGSGCVFNPYGKVHVRGPEFLGKNALQTEKAVVLSYLLSQAAEITTEGYKSPLDRLYCRVAGILASTAEPLLEALKLQESNVYTHLTKEDFFKAYVLKKSLSKILGEMKKVLGEANLELPPELVEEALTDAIMQSDEN